MKIPILAIVVAVPLLVSGRSALSADISRVGSTVTMSGRIRHGDDVRFDKVVADGGVNTLVLNVPGGEMIPTAAIARQVRSLRLTTVVDAARASCNSACGPVFAAGVQRHYMNSAGVREGLGSKNGQGLGFHQAGGSRGTSIMIQLFNEMGVPTAAELVDRATNDQMFFISGQTALQRGIATSLSRPR